MQEVTHGKVKEKERSPKRLGDVLLARGLITPEQLKIALEIQKSTNKLLGEILLDLGFVDQGSISSILSDNLEVKYLSSLEDIVPDPQALSLVPQDIAQKYKVVPLHVEENVLTVVVADPFDIVSVDTLRNLTGKTIETVCAPEEEINKAIDLWYTETETFDDVVKKALEVAGVADLGLEEPPVIKLVNYIIVTAIKKRATDIHLEPEKNVLMVRYRVDGILHVWKLLPRELTRSIVSRIKIMASLDISETRVPQDGRIGFYFAGRHIDLRVSTCPTAEGENIVLRILDKSKLITKISDIGYSPKQLETFHRILSHNYGLILITGPTGSGKTTTLYAALMEKNSTQINIMTIEDPIEYKLPFIRQSQINPKSNFTFAKGLRALMRQDPDVILVGEIRDSETLEIALHAALTGHLVLSTLHTNTAISAISRLLYMGASPYILGSSLAGIAGQRLVRMICPFCREPYKPSEHEIKVIEQYIKLESDSEITLYKGKGCEKCNHTGYLKRTCVSEIFEVTPEVTDLIVKREEESKIEALVREQGFISMLEDGLLKAVKGITTVEEVLRIV
ncbi:GspE/PulE family protein [Desulfothermus sp.]